MAKTSRQVDIKALVSHIVRGDGADRCRICMGDTVDGQVHLEDTIMMDGDRAVTLAELLEVITGVEVEMDNVLPDAICGPCSEDIFAVMSFKNLCGQSMSHWDEATTVLAQVHEPTEDDKAYFVFYTEEKTIVKDQIDRVPNVDEALKRLNTKFLENPKKVRHRRKKSLNVSCSCRNCGKQFPSPEYLNIHLKNSLDRACLKCGAVMAKKNLVSHYTAEHDLYVFDCSICHAIFEDELSLRQHCAEHKIAGFSCRTCGNSFNNSRGLSAHIAVHTLFHCEPCNLSFDNLNCFKYHQKQCKVDEQVLKFNNFICNDCGAMYDRKSSLRVHIIQKHLHVLPYVCQVCGKRASTLAHLRSHEKVHKTERNVYQCYCGAKMRTELGYQLHQRIHTGERPYECEFCDERFLSSSRRLDHVKRRHIGPKDMPHACEKCSARFVRPCELRKHYLIAHYIEVDVKPAKREVNPVTRRFRRTNVKQRSQ